MKNRAKCKLCLSIIESFHSEDHVQCKCSHIAVFGGDSLRCSAIDWGNFLRVDDEGNEICVKTSQDTKENPEINVTKPNKKDLLKMLKDMGDLIENLPPQAMNASITHYDFWSLIVLVSSILETED